MRVYAQIDAINPPSLASAPDVLVIDLRGVSLDRLTWRNPVFGLTEIPTFLRLQSVDAIGTERLREAIELTRAAGLVVPAAGGRDVAKAGAMLAVAEAELGFPDRGMRLIAMIDEPRAILAADSFSGCSARLTGLAWDAERIANQPGARDPWLPDHRWSGILVQSRALVRLAAAAAKVEAIEAASPVADARSSRAIAQAAIRDGFTAMLARSSEEIVAIREAASEVARP